MTSDIVPAGQVNVDVETLKYLGYNPTSIPTRALVALAVRYELDPLLGEIQLISTSQGPKVYVSRDGMLAIAHRSGQLDGIVVDEQRRNTEGNGWTAYVSVWRKDMGHPFRYGAQCKDSEPQAKAGNGPEMALARAERRALRRAFIIHTDFYPGRSDTIDIEDLDGDDIEPLEDDPVVEAVLGPPDDPAPTPKEVGEAPPDVDVSGLPDGYSMTPNEMLVSVKRMAIEHRLPFPKTLESVDAELWALWKAGHNSGGDPF